MSQSAAKDLQDQIETAFPANTLAEARDVSKVIARLSSALAATPDHAFLSRYAEEASKMLGADYFIISRLNPYSNIMRTLYFLEDGKPQNNITYSLDGTPCARAVEGDMCIHPENVDELFPHDKFLKDCGVSGYVGAPLRSAKGDTLGVVLALTKKPIADEAVAIAVVSHFCDRIAHTIESTETLERYSWAVAEASDGVWDWDVLTGGATISKGIQNILGYADDDGPYDLTDIEKSIHPHERENHREALKLHLTQGAPFDVVIRLRGGDGEYRWYRSRGAAIRNETGRPARMIGAFINIDKLVRDGQLRT